MHVTQKFVPWILRHADLPTVTRLLNRMGDEIEITELDLIAVVHLTRRSGDKVMALLLDRRGPQVKITEAVILAAIFSRDDPMKSPYYGYSMVVLLLDRRKDEIEITETVFIAAVNNSMYLANFLLDQKGDEIQITEGIVAAVKGWKFQGESLLQRLLLLQDLTPSVRGSLHAALVEQQAENERFVTLRNSRTTRR